MKADRASIRFRSEATKVDRITIPPIHPGSSSEVQVSLSGENHQNLHKENAFR
ncbi:MAG: hypothetical protein K0R37_2492 [Arthrobacter sp.]|nr:hypothetical protein [Arthrobacter sp.]